ncbi:MAG TPA: metallophosphoesterase family protein [Firmicutes bacterium]|nr:metallophosphoesterase family protein [Bacillota bacterium]
MRIGVISDTHVPVRARVLPGAVFEVLAGVDLILHAGDLVTLDVLDELAAIAPVMAVHGNVDRPEVIERLPAVLRVEVGADGSVKVNTTGSQPNGKPLIIGLVHGHDGAGRTTPERAASHFPDAGVVVFGHSHQPLNEWREGRLFFNPGSATDPRRAPWPSVGVIEVGRAVRAVRAEIIRLAG